MHINKSDLWQTSQIKKAILNSIPKLDPRRLWRSPVMFAVEMGAILTTLITAHDLITGGNAGFDGQISLWLWFTILFANFAEALAEGRGRAQAETLRQAKSEAIACQRRSCPGKGRRDHPQRRRDQRRGRTGGRISHHGRIGASSSRGWRRPMRRHWRN
jgi:K+-transporting ATPase ATPase B chain